MEEIILKTKDDGSTITLKQVQAMMLDMLKDIAEVCKKNAIPFFLEGGSALGAVRHHGFIPWDDDVDIAIFRKDYEAFMEALDRDLPDNYLYQCFEKDERYNVLIPTMKIRRKDTYIKEVNSLLENRCIGYDGCDGIFIDVFVYDYASTEKMLGLYHRVANYFWMVPEIVIDNVFHKNPVWIKKRIFHHARKHAALAKKTGKNQIGYDLTWLWKKFFNPNVYDWDTIFPLVEVPFEDTMMPIMHDAHKYLETTYGKDYMVWPSEDKRYAKHVIDIEI